MRSQAAASRGLWVAMIDVRPYALMHVAQQGVQGVGGLLVEVARGLVGQQHRGAHDQRARDGNPLLLPAREHPGPVREPFTEPDAAQQLFGARAGLGHRDARNPHRHLGVLERGELRQEMVKLEDEPDAVIPEADDGGVVERRQAVRRRS